MELHSTNPPSHSGMPLPLPPRLLPSPRAMRRVLAFARACPAASPNLPSAAARSCRAARRAATAARAARSKGSSAANRIAGRSAAERGAAGRLHAFSLPRRPNKPVPCSSHFTLLTRPPPPARLADPKQRERGGCAAEFLGAGTQVVYAASRCGPLEPPTPQISRPSKTLRAERRSA